MNLRNFNFIKFLFCIIVLGLFVFLEQTVTAVPEEPSSPASAPIWNNQIPITNKTNTPNGASRPFVKAAPNGKTVMIVYSKQTGGVTEFDPYYSRSTNNGQTWSSPQPVYTSSAPSLQVNIDYDRNNQAHAVWIEGATIAYAKESSWPNSFTPISTADIEVDFPKIYASGNNTLDVVWTQQDIGGDFEVFHARSTNGGSSWPITGRILSTPTNVESASPDLVVDASGNIHVVWAEQAAALEYDIYYVRSTNGGSSWSNPIVISNASNPNDARHPQITISGNTLHVSYTDRTGSGLANQFVHHIYCSSGCTNSSGNWKSDGIVSGQKVGANSNTPFVVFSTIAQLGSCTYVYFHGTVDGLPDNNEIIWGTNSCGGWTASARDQVTATNVRSLHPQLDVQNNWWLYLTYDQVPAGESESQIFVIVNQPALYLPFIIK